MNGNFKYQLTDEQRRRLRWVATGRESKQLATRAQVCEFLEGCLDAVLSEARPVEPIVPARQELPMWARAEAERLERDGKDPSYIRGWIQVMLRRRQS